MEKSKWCDICKRDKCIRNGGIHDMSDIKPDCYVEVEMVEYEGFYVPRELCTTDRLGGIDDCMPCSEYCSDFSGGDCGECIVTKVFNEYARITNQV